MASLSEDVIPEQTETRWFPALIKEMFAKLCNGGLWLVPTSAHEKHYYVRPTLQ